MDEQEIKELEAKNEQLRLRIVQLRERKDELSNYGVSGASPMNNITTYTTGITGDPNVV